MVILSWLACATPRPVQTVSVVDGVSGRPRADVEMVFHDAGETDSCRQAFRTDAKGQATVSLCSDELYVLQSASTLVVWPEVEVTAAGVPPIRVWDLPTADGLYLVGDGEVLLLAKQVDVKRVSPRKMTTKLAVPAVIPLQLPAWSADRGLLAKGTALPSAYPLVPVEGPVVLSVGEPLLDWFGVGMGLDGRDQSVKPSDAATVSLLGVTVWVNERLPSGRYGLWDGESERMRVVEVP